MLAVKRTWQLQLDSLLQEVFITNLVGQTVHLLCCNAFIFHVMDDQYTLTTSYNNTTKVALDKTVSYTISCIKAYSTGQVQSSLSSSLINSRICWLNFVKMTQQLELDSLLQEVCITDLGQTLYLVCCNVFIFHILDKQ